MTAAVLGMLTFIGFSVLRPALSKAKWNDRKQDRLQGFVVARERLSRLLTPARLLEPIGPESVTFIQRRSVETPWGEIPVSNETETLAWDEDNIHTVVVEQGSLLQLSSKPQERRLLWSLGEGASLAVSRREDSPLVDFTFSLPAEEDSVSWEASFTLHLRGVP